jgi:hypothetical protein
VFPTLGVVPCWSLVLDVAWLGVPAEPKLYTEFVRELADVAFEHAGICLVGAAADVVQQRVALFYSREDAAQAFERDWRSVARRVKAEMASARRSYDLDDLPF